MASAIRQAGKVFAKGFKEVAKSGAESFGETAAKTLLNGRTSPVFVPYQVYSRTPSPAVIRISERSTPSLPLYNPQVTFPTKCICSRPSTNTLLTFNDKYAIDCMYCGSSNNTPEKVIDDYILLKGSATNLEKLLSASSSFDQQKRFARATEGLDSKTTLANDELAKYVLPENEGKNSETEEKNNYPTELAQEIGLAEGGKRRNRSRKIRKRRNLKTRRGGKN